MKRVFLSVAFAAAAQFGYAQDFKSDVVKFLKISGTDAGNQVAKDQLKGYIAADKHAEFSKEFDEKIIPQITDIQAKMYMEVYTHDDIKEFIKFYESPVGKKMTSKSKELTEKQMLIQQEMGMVFQGLMMKYAQ